MPRFMPVRSGATRTSSFGMRWGTMHRGTDYGRDGGSGNDPVYAAQGGTVVHAGPASGFGGPDPAGWVVIDHPTADGSGTTVYGHIIREVHVGQRVEAGQRIGRINPSQGSNGGVAPHLHFEVHPTVWSPGSQIDPVPWLAGASWTDQPPPSEGKNTEGTQVTVKPNPQWRGDPTFLPEVLKAFGLEVRVLDGAFDRGHGDFGTIQGIIIHHIGSDRYDAWNIARHPSLGLCSQLHLSREGVVTVTGVGIAWHAGKGAHKGWPTNDANRVSIGIEAESNGTSAWPKAEMDAYHRMCAAILWFLGKRATPDTLLSHWEYSLEAQGKWDPGAGVGHGPRSKYDYAAMLNMNNFRAEVNKIIDAHNTGSTPEKGALVEAFDKIRRRFQSRVPGSSFEGDPLDYLLNADAHAFVSRANSEKILEKITELEKKLEAR